jgi:hypothetical protein
VAISEAGRKEHCMLRDAYLDPQVGCRHRVPITECERCQAERVRLLEWQRRTEELYAAELPVWARGGWNTYLSGLLESGDRAGLMESGDLWPTVDPVPTLTRGAIK